MCAHCKSVRAVSIHTMYILFDNVRYNVICIRTPVGVRNVGSAKPRAEVDCSCSCHVFAFDDIILLQLQAQVCRVIAQVIAVAGPSRGHVKPSRSSSTRCTNAPKTLSKHTAKFTAKSDRTGRRR